MQLGYYRDTERLCHLSGSPLAWRLDRQIPSAFVHHLVQLQTQAEGRKGAVSKDTVRMSSLRICLTGGTIDKQRCVSV